MAGRNERFYSDKPPDRRSPFERDRDRILYSSAFRRLAEVTQVVSSEEGHVFHNRLTHSLEVAQFGRRLAERLREDQSDTAEELGGIEPDVVEAACLAHDLGHPPFGHVAEKQLNDLVTQRQLLNGFEGNAQTFRILNKLALTSKDHPGLNLTRATLNAVLKYPWLRSTGGERQLKWGAYETEKEELNWAREDMQPPGDERKCAEAELMDWADDVTYAVHDTADFYKAGLVPLERLSSTTDNTERKRFCDEVFSRHKRAGMALRFPEKDLAEAFWQMLELYPFDRPYEGNREDRSRLRNLTTGLIGRYISALNLHLPKRDTERRVVIDAECEKEVFMLKQLTWHYVILRPSLATQQYGKQKIITDLFEVLHEAVEKHKFSVFPVEVREELMNASNVEMKLRTIADLIASMTERQVVNLHARLTGRSLGSVLDAI